MHHDLKIWPVYFETADQRTCELRVNDRPFAAGDTIRLREWDPKTSDYTGREKPLRRIWFVFTGFAVPEGYALLSLAPAYAPMLHPGEPHFVLRAQDRLAATQVREWAYSAMAMEVPHEKAQDALSIAAEMEGWPARKLPD